MTQLSDLYSCNYTLIYDITLDMKIVAYELCKLQDMSYSDIIFLCQSQEWTNFMWMVSFVQ